MRSALDYKSFKTPIEFNNSPPPFNTTSFRRDLRRLFMGVSGQGRYLTTTTEDLFYKSLLNIAERLARWDNYLKHPPKSQPFPLRSVENMMGFTLAVLDTCATNAQNSTVSFAFHYMSHRIAKLQGREVAPPFDMTFEATPLETIINQSPSKDRLIERIHACQPELEAYYESVKAAAHPHKLYRNDVRDLPFHLVYK